MADQIVLPARKPHDPAMDQIVKLAVMAVGGQGGGVLTNWIEDCGRLNGYAVQATSVAGVAQRTGATPAQLSLAWLLRRSPVMLPIPGTKSLTHLEENCAAGAVELDDATFAELDALGTS